MSDVGDFYDLAVRRRIEAEKLRLELREARGQLAEKYGELLDADREIRALRDELDYAHSEIDDLQRQVDELSTPGGPAVPGVDINLRDVQSPRRQPPPRLQPRGTTRPWPARDG